MRKASLAVVAVLSFFVLTAQAADEVNPQYTLWSKFKVGAYSTLSTETTTKGKSVTQTITTKLTALTADKATVQTSTSIVVMGNTINTPGRSQDIPAKLGSMHEIASDLKSAMSPATQPADPNAKTGTEGVKVGDKTVSTTWTESTSTKDGATTHIKFWRSDAVPGGTVKMTSETTGKHEATINSTLTDFSAGG